MSDLCADDIWSYDNLHRYERDDYLTTLAELNAAPDNCYNFAAANQVDRFIRLAAPAERAQLKRALRSGRFHVTPVPNQFLCGGLILSAYPLALEPYRRICAWAGAQAAPLSADAYHMEATTWTNGLVNLLSCAGFRSFTKSLLHYQSPWMHALSKLPPLQRLEVAPGREVLFWLRCWDYFEARPLLSGAITPAQFARESILPRYEQLGDDYPIDAVCVVGMYGDLAPNSPTLAATKLSVLAGGVDQTPDAATCPRLLNSTLARFFDRVIAQLDAEGGWANLKSVRGDTGSSWEAWPLAAQAEWAAYRRAQREVMSLRVLDAMQPLAQTPATRGLLTMCASELVALADHAWNGDENRPDVKALNLSIRRRRLAKLSFVSRQLRLRIRRGARPKPGADMAVVNTLGWARNCRVRLMDRRLCLTDTRTGEAFPSDQAGWIEVPDVPAFGARAVTVREWAGSPRQTRAPLKALTRLKLDMRPVLFAGKQTFVGVGGWSEAGSGAWRAGPFDIRAELQALAGQSALELELRVSGKPPPIPYELCWQVDLPWRKCIWRGESGGGFSTPGPVDRGGDSLLGIAGSIFAAGEGLSVSARRARGRIDFAFGESGLCGLGGRTTTRAQGRYGEAVDEEVIRRAQTTSCETDGELVWYLLGNAQNVVEALLDQGGARAWYFHCAIRGVAAGFDDADLYHFASAYTWPAELTSAQFAGQKGAWLDVSPSAHVLVLGVSRRGERHEIDVYNTSRETQPVVVKGRLVRGKSIAVADMLGYNDRPCRRGRFTLPPLAFAKVVIE